MAVTSGKPKEKIAITIGHTNLANVKKAIENGEFSSVSDVIDKAVTFFFENRNKATTSDDFKAWILSKEGEVWIKSIIRKVMEE